MKICKNICNNTKKYIPDFLFIIYILWFLNYFDNNTKDLELIISAGFLVCSFFLLEIIVLYHLEGIIIHNRIINKMNKVSIKWYIVLAILITIIKHYLFNNLVINMLLAIIFYILFIKISGILTSEKYRNSIIIQLLEYYLVFIMAYLVFANLFQEIIRPCISNKYSNFNKSSDYRDYNDLWLYYKGYFIPLIAAITIMISTVISFLSSYFIIYKKHIKKKIKKRYVNIYNIISVFVMFFSKTYNYFEEKDAIKHLKFSDQFSNNNLFKSILVILIAGVKKYYMLIYLVIIYMLIFVNLHEEDNNAKINNDEENNKTEIKKEGSDIVDKNEENNDKENNDKENINYETNK